MPDIEGEALLADAVQQPETGAEATRQEEVNWEAEATKWKTLSRQNEAQAKANAEKAREFDAYQESQKTELQKVQDALAAANAARDEAVLKALKSDISRTTGVPVELLTGTDEATLTAAAEAAQKYAQSLTRAPASSGFDGSSGAAQPTIYHQWQIGDPEFFQAHRADILNAQMEGRIIP